MVTQDVASIILTTDKHMPKHRVEFNQAALNDFTKNHKMWVLIRIASLSQF